MLKKVTVIINIRNPVEHDTEDDAQASQAITVMQNLSVIALCTVKYHRKLAIVDSEILWEGSLNIFSQNNSCEIMRRIEIFGSVDDEVLE